MREGTSLTISLFTVITVVTLIASPLFGHNTIYPKNDWRKLTFCFLSAQSWASGRHTLPLHPGYTSVPRASLAPLRVTPFRPNSPRFRLFCLGRGRFCLRLGLRLFCWPSATRMHTRASRSAWGSSRLVVAHCSRHLTKSIMATYER